MQIHNRGTETLSHGNPLRQARPVPLITKHLVQRDHARVVVRAVGHLEHPPVAVHPSNLPVVEIPHALGGVEGSRLGEVQHLRERDGAQCAFLVLWRAGGRVADGFPLDPDGHVALVGGEDAARAREAGRVVGVLLVPLEFFRQVGVGEAADGDAEGGEAVGDVEGAVAVQLGEDGFRGLRDAFKLDQVLQGAVVAVGGAVGAGG